MVAARFAAVLRAAAVGARRYATAGAILLIAGIRLAYPNDYPSYWHHDWAIPSYNALHLAATSPLTARDYGAAGVTNAELWLYHALFWLFGAHTWVVHLPNALASIGVCLCVYGITARLVDRRTGLIAMLLLGTQWVFLLFSRTPELEIFLLPLALGLWIAVATWQQAGRKYERETTNHLHHTSQRLWLKIPRSTSMPDMPYPLGTYSPERQSAVSHLRQKSCFLLAGAIAATSAWSWRASLIGVPLAAVCILFTPQWWRYSLRWLCIAAGATVVLWPLYQHGDFPLFAEKLGYRQWEWPASVWLEQVDHTIGTLWGKYPNTESWGMTKQTQLLLPIDLILLIGGGAIALWQRETRQLACACLTAVAVVLFCGGVLIRHTYTDWCHLLAMLPFCAVLMALGLWKHEAAVALVALSVGTNLLIYWATSCAAPASIVTVNRMLADSRAANCVSVLHQGLPLDSAFFWFVRDVPVLQNHGQEFCQVVIDARTADVRYVR